jgi:hypothetical protein
MSEASNFLHGGGIAIKFFSFNCQHDPPRLAMLLTDGVIHVNILLNQLCQCKILAGLKIRKDTYIHIITYCISMAMVGVKCCHGTSWNDAQLY